MRLQVASCHRILLLLINFIIQGLSADQNKHEFKRSLSGSNSLMDTMMKKYSYPKSEVTAGVGYGHHLHPFYYRGEKEMMYPCAVECGEWETMTLNDNANDASSNVDVVTVHPDVSTIDITTTKSRLYKDTSFLRPKKYKSSLFSTASTPSSTAKSTSEDDFAYQDSKGADVQILPQKSENGYLGESDTNKEIPNDGSLYAKYYDTLVSGYGGEIGADYTRNKDNEYFDPVEESMRYNSPSFNDADNDDIEAPVYPTNTESHPERERIEEKYVKHNVREERLEDVRTNSFGPFDEDEDYPTDSTSGKEPSGYDPLKYIDDYAAPIKPRHPQSQNYQVDKYKGGFAGSSGAKPFRPSPAQGQVFQRGESHPPITHSGHFRGHNERLRPFHNPRNKIPHQDPNGYSGDYQAEDNYGVEGETDYDESPPKSGSYYSPMNSYNIQQGQYYGKKYPYGRTPDLKLFRRPSVYGRNRKYPPQTITGFGNHYRSPYSQPENLSYPSKFPSKQYHGSYPRSLYSENGGGPGQSYNPYAPRHGYSPQSQEFPASLSSGGIRVVPPPRIRAHSTGHGNFPYHTTGVRNGPYVRGQRISYRRTIPQKDGFTKIIKNYRSFVDHTPKRYVGSGQPYVRT